VLLSCLHGLGNYGGGESSRVGSRNWASFYLPPDEPLPNCEDLHDVGGEVMD